MRLIFILAAISVTSFVQGQHPLFLQSAQTDTLKAPRFWQLNYITGIVAPTHTTAVDAIESKPWTGIDLKYGVQGQHKPWHALHHFPTYGVGIGKIWFRPNNNIVGNPVTAYIFYQEPLLRFHKSKLALELKMGLATNWKPYEQFSNPDQKVIGSSVTGYGGVRLNYIHPFSDRLGMTIGAGLDHFSNGRMRSPNRGLNLIGAQVAVNFNINPIHAGEFHPQTIKAPDHPVSYELNVVGSLGMVTTFAEINDRNFYRLAGSFSLDGARHYSLRGKYGVGLDWTYDESLKVLYKNNYPSGDVPFSVLNWYGVHGSHEYMIHRWTIITQAGVNLKQVGDKGVWYGRLGVRYDLTQSVFLRLGLRVYGSVVSDFIEWGAGYSWYRYK